MKNVCTYSPQKKYKDKRRCGSFRTICCFLFCFAVVVFGISGYAMYYQSDDLLFVINAEQPLGYVSDKFLSVSLDSSVIRHGWISESIRSPQLLKRAFYLAPAYLRVGGTAADLLLFDPSPVEEKNITLNDSLAFIDAGVCSFEGYSCHHKQDQFFMSGEEWIGINEFADQVGMDLIFDLNVLLRTEEKWNSSNAEQLIKFSSDNRFTLSWQLGNEPNAFQHVFNISISADKLAEDFKTLKEILESFPQYKSSLLIGPDISRPQHLGYFRQFLKNIGNSTIDVVSWHQYYVNARNATLKDFISPKNLELLEQEILHVRKVVSEFFPSVPIWLTETSSAYGGGAHGLSDRFVAGFMWLDKLGLAAKMGIDVVVRQSLFHGRYGLLNEFSWIPRPDWWLSVLFKTLVGTTVLSVENDLAGKDTVRLYCHCAHSSLEPSSITIYGMNLEDKHIYVYFSYKSVYITPSGNRSAYILTGEDGLASSSVLLNGKVLELKPDGTLPSFVPTKEGIKTPLLLPPYSIGFWVLHGINVQACLH